MADAIEKLLEPGERAVWLDRGAPNWHALAVLVAVHGILITDAVWTSGSLHPGAWSATARLYLVLAGPLLVLALLASACAKTAVTERRLLHRTYWISGKIELDLADITGVRLGPDGTVRVTRRRGGELGIGARRPRGFAAALARAAGLPEPAAVGLLAWLWPAATAIGPVTSVAVLLLLFGDVLATEGLLDGLGAFGLVIPRLAGVIWGSFVLGTHSAALLGLVLMRPWVGAEEARAWLSSAIDPAEKDSWSRMVSALLLWNNPLFPWLAELLWGPAARPGNGEAAGHG